jgi:hypothetical protein
MGKTAGLNQLLFMHHGTPPKNHLLPVRFCCRPEKNPAGGGSMPMHRVIHQWFVPERFSGKYRGLIILLA